MDKKVKILYFTILIVNIICFCLNFTSIDFPFLRLSVDLSLLLIGLVLFIRAIKFKIDSSMFVGIALLLCGGINLVAYLENTFWQVDLNLFWQYYVFAFAVASCVTGVYFKDKLQLKLTALFFGFGIITLIFVYGIVKLRIYLLLMTAWFVAYFVFDILIRRKDKNV